MQKRRKFATFCASVLLLLTMASCNEDSSKLAIDKIRVINGAEQCVKPNSEFTNVLRVELLSSVQKGIFGGAGSRKVLANRLVTVKALNNSDIIFEKNNFTSNDAGVIDIKMTSGQNIGDHYIELTAHDKISKKITVRQIVGITIDGASQEGFVGDKLSNPLNVSVYNADGTPAINVPVYFSIGITPELSKPKMKLSDNTVYTDKNGIASTEVTLGKKTGEYFVGVEVADKNLHIRNHSIKFFGIGSWAVFIAVAGGLAIFILGMKLMSDGLQKVAGENMKKMLQLFAKNAWIAALAGTIVTAVIQSSSATTVMVIGFINAGLLNLVQAVGIIFGANIGTTITAQIISLDLNGLAMPAIVVGLLITLIFKRRIMNGWGETILGFGLLFFGMMLMSKELKVLGSFPSFIEFFKSFECEPINGYMPFLSVLGAIGIGTLMTVIIQSSSAAMGIILALAASGLIDFYTAIPLLLGTNIGTTITAFFAALAANRVAKQAALAHTMFNLFGTIIMVTLFYVPYHGQPIFLYFINTITPGDAFAEVPENLERHIAMAHTFFNVVVVLMLLPMISIFTKICTMILPIKGEESLQTVILEPHLLNTPSIALEQTINAIRSMLKRSCKMINISVNEYFFNSKVDEAGFAKLDEEENKIDEMQQSITDYLVQITRHELTLQQSSLVPLLMHCTNSVEKIADHTEIILQLTERLAKTKGKMSQGAKNDLIKMYRLVNLLEREVLTSIHSSEPISLVNTSRLKTQIVHMAGELENNHIKRLRSEECNLKIGIIYLEMVTELEKIALHLGNIADRTPEIQKHYIKI